MRAYNIIIESVDSNVGIARTRNIWQCIKISPNLKNGELISLYDYVLFIFECFHDQQVSQWREKASRKYPTQQQQNGQIVFLLSSDELAHYCVNLSRWFTHETAAFILGSARPIAFFLQLRSLARRS